MTTPNPRKGRFTGPGDSPGSRRAAKVLRRLSVLVGMTACGGETVGSIAHHESADAASDGHEGATVVGPLELDATAERAPTRPDDGSTAPEVDASRGLACSRCGQVPPHVDVMSVYARLKDGSCLAVRLTSGPSCDGLDIGAGDWCMYDAELWPFGEVCPPRESGASLHATGASGTVVGHDGALWISVDLAFSTDAGTKDVTFDFRECTSVTIEDGPCF